MLSESLPAVHNRRSQCRVGLQCKIVGEVYIYIGLGMQLVQIVVQHAFKQGSPAVGKHKALDWASELTCLAGFHG